MFTPQQAVRLIDWFRVMEKEIHPDKDDIKLLRQIVELLKDAEGSEGPDYITYKECYKRLTDVEIPQLERTYEYYKRLRNVEIAQNDLDALSCNIDNI